MVQFPKAASPPDGEFFRPPMSADPNHDGSRSRLSILNTLVFLSGSFYRADRSLADISFV
jgi:hypothetical protein